MDKIYRLIRKDLEDVIAGVKKVPLSLVVAPMGYGKTTAIRSYLERTEDSHFVWITMGQEFVDEEWVWQKLCEKVQYLNETMAQCLKEIGFPKERKDTDQLLQMIGGKISEPLYFVLDDYQECDSEAINTFITRLVYEDIKNLHLIIISRIYPKFPWEELMIKGYCKIINQQYLTLSRAELKELCSKSGMEFTKEELDTIEKYTDGWISAVCLALLDYRRKKKLQLSVNILHLLKAAVFDGLGEELQSFFMKMSLFDDFQLEEAAYITGYEIQGMWLDEMMETVGFLQYDSLTERYSMHFLLKCVALEEFNRRGDTREHLYNRCAEWNESAKRMNTALIYYLKAGNTDGIFHILDGEERFFLYQSAGELIEDFFQKTPLQQCMEHPTAYLSYLYFMLYAAKGQRREAAKQRYWEAVDFYNQKHKPETYHDLKGELKYLETQVRFNDLEQMLECIKEACTLRKDKMSQIFPGTDYGFGTPGLISLYHTTPGTLKKTIELHKEYVKFHARLITKEDSGWEEIIEAEYQLSVGNLKEAAHLIEIAFEKARFRNSYAAILSCYYIQLRLLIYFGDKRGLFERLKQAEAETRGMNNPVLNTEYDLIVGYINAMVNRLEDVPAWLRNYKLEECNFAVRSVRSGCLTYGLCLKQKKQWSLLDSIAEQMLITFGGVKHIYVDLNAYLLKTAATLHLEGMERACEFCEKALMLAEADGICIPVIDHSPELLPVLEQVKQKNSFAAKLWTYCETHVKKLKIFEEKEGICLTEREQQIMKLVKEGQRNNDIGRNLNIALVTVEKNLTSIYRKLNVNNRTAAIAKVTELYDL